MSQQPDPADPRPGEDLAWLDRDPMTAAEREAYLDRVCEEDEPPGEEEYEDYAPLTPDELAGIREAAADELLAVKAATTGRRGPGQPGSARSVPGRVGQPGGGVRAGDGAGRAARLRGPGGRRRRRLRRRRRVRRVSDAELRRAVRLGPGRGARRGPQARRHRRAGPPRPRAGGRGVHRRSAGLRPGRLPRPRRRPAGPRGFSRTPGCPARRRRCWTGSSPGTRPRPSQPPPRCWTRTRRPPPRPRCWTGRPG